MHETTGDAEVFYKQSRLVSGSMNDLC